MKYNQKLFYRVIRGNLRYGNSGQVVSPRFSCYRSALKFMRRLLLEERVYEPFGDQYDYEIIPENCLQSKLDRFGVPTLYAQ